MNVDNNKKCIFVFLQRTILVTIILASSSCGSMTKMFCSWCDISPEKYASGKYFDYSRTKEIKQGMDVDQVIDILGKPYTIVSSAVDKQFIWNYSVNSVTNTFVVKFMTGTHGKVTNTQSNHLQKDNSYGIEY